MYNSLILLVLHQSLPECSHSCKEIACTITITTRCLSFPTIPLKHIPNPLPFDHIFLFDLFLAYEYKHQKTSGLSPQYWQCINHNKQNKNYNLKNNTYIYICKLKKVYCYATIYADLCSSKMQQQDIWKYKCQKLW